jgi:hypothetical protein
MPALFGAKRINYCNYFVARVALEVVDSAWWKEQLLAALFAFAQRVYFATVVQGDLQYCSPMTRIREMAEIRLETYKVSRRSHATPGLRRVAHSLVTLRHPVGRFSLFCRFCRRGLFVNGE